ncbi:MAG: DUF6607 family protein [Pseudomonadota bacterium]
MERLAAALALFAVMLASGCATTGDTSLGASGALSEEAAFQADRKAILSMAGDFEVTFDFTETVAFREGYELKPPKLSAAREVVRVIEDRGDFISLQHILVAGDEGEQFAIKHWRQDWRYEPSDVLIFVGGNAWERRAVGEGGARGQWSQTVHQVDDAPRYAALGRWTHKAGASAWTSPAEWRPLPRRDATTRDDYHAIDAINVHAITPDGWVHEQNNSKLVLTGGSELLAREIGVNTYRRSEAVDASVAEAYWRDTKAYWSAIRTKWAAIEAENPSFGLTIQGEPEELYMLILGFAEALADGDVDLEEAIADGGATLDQYVTTDIGLLADRLAD